MSLLSRKDESGRCEESRGRTHGRLVFLPHVTVFLWNPSHLTMTMMDTRQTTVFFISSKNPLNTSTELLEACTFHTFTPINSMGNLYLERIIDYSQNATRIYLCRIQHRANNNQVPRPHAFAMHRIVQHIRREIYLRGHHQANRKIQASQKTSLNRHKNPKKQQLAAGSRISWTC